MFTRKEYLDGKCSHESYYSQFVNDRTKQFVLHHFSIETLKIAYLNDIHFNTIPLIEWDSMPIPTITAESMKKAGDYLTLAGKVCILKEAARQLVIDS